MDYTTYITKQDERWDSIAWAARGNAYAYSDIITANPQYRSLLRLPAGVVLKIPVQESVVQTVSVEKLPPWRR